MADTPLAPVVRHLHKLAGLSPTSNLSDAQLLERFVQRRDEDAFAALVRRHGPLVWRVCRRVLHQTQHAEEAYQAVFLVLARQAAKVRNPAALASFLYGVAYRIARQARADLLRQSRQREPIAAPVADPAEDAAWRELEQIVVEEVHALPEKYRTPILLCYWEGLTNEEAAVRLGWPAGTVKTRLLKARQRLHECLTRRGVSLSAGTVVTLLAVGSADATMPPILAATAARLALDGTAGASAAVTALADQAIQGAMLSKVKIILVLLLGSAITASVGAFAYHKPPARQPEEQPKAKSREAEQPKAQAEQPKIRTDRYGDPLPAGAIARLGTVRLRAVGGHVGLSSDGKTIITVATGRQVKLWDADTGKLRERRELLMQTFMLSLLSPDGRLLAGIESYESPLDIWDVLTGKRLHRLQLPQRQTLYRAEFSPNGKSLAVAMHGGAAFVVRLWDMESGEQRELKGHTSTPQHLTFSADGKLLASSDQQRVICWDVAKGEQLWIAKGGGGFLAFAADGRTLIASPDFQERAWHAWDAATGKPAKRLKLPEGYKYAQLTVAPDGRTLLFARGRDVVGADGRVRLWDLQTGKLLHTLSVRGEIGPFFPDGRSFLTNDGALQRWELATGRPLLPDTDELGHRAEVNCAVYSLDGRRLASAASDGTIRLWDVAKAKPLHILRGAEWRVFGMAFTPDGKRLVSGGTQGELVVWDTETGNELRRIPLHDPKLKEKKQNIWRLHATPDGRTVIVLGYDPSDGGIGKTEGILTTWDLETGRRNSRLVGKGSDGFYSAFSPDGRLLASEGELLDTEKGKTRMKLEGGVGTWFPNYAFSPDGRQVAGLIRWSGEASPTGIKMEGIQIWDAASGRALRRIATERGEQLAFSPDGRYLAAADLQGLVLWELATGQVVLRHKAHEKMRGSYGNSFASCLSFAPDGRSLATGHVDSTVLLWNLVPPADPSTAEDLSRSWDALTGSEAVKAYAASWRLSNAPTPALPFLRKRLWPVTPAPAEQTQPVLADLDSSSEFLRREAAAAQLRELGDRAETAMREALKAKPSLEMRRRLEGLLRTLEESPSGEMLRAMRAAAVLERIGTPETRQILEELTKGAPEARLTREAKASLQRLTRLKNLTPRR